MKIIIASGQQVLVDDKDFVMFAKYSWSVNSSGYAHANINGTNRMMHALLMPARLDKVVDHENEDKLDNRRFNLRYIGHGHNLQRSSKRKGYYFQKSKGKWHATIKINGKPKFLGLFTEAWQARQAYLAARKEHIGE